MTPRRPARTTARRAPTLLVVVLAAITAISVARGFQSLAPSSATATSPAVVPRREPVLASPSSTAAVPVDVPPTEPRIPRSADHDARGEADGAVPDGTTVFDDDVPGVANLDPDLLAALRRAATDARRDGVELRVDSGWRSAAYQERLLQEAISKYGSAREAARWVATPETSLHVSGDAVDLGPSRATAWLHRHGAAYGLCQIYRNESWHYEMRPDAAAHGCPAMYADPTHDPRMQ